MLTFIYVLNTCNHSTEVCNIYLHDSYAAKNVYILYI